MFLLKGVLHAVYFWQALVKVAHQRIQLEVLEGLQGQISEGMGGC